ncbi:MAG: response regulator transcription factor [Fusobacteriaceae bacterium]
MILVFGADLAKKKDIANVVKCIHSGAELFYFEQEKEILDKLALGIVGNYSLCLLMMAENPLDTIRLIKNIRKISNLPIIFYSENNDEEFITKGYEAGGNLFLLLPFSRKMLAATCRKYILKEKETITFGEIKLNKLSKEVHANNLLIDFSCKEFKVFEVLMENHTQVLSRSQIIDEVWENFSDINERTVDYHIVYIKRKLGKFNAHIATLQGHGYRFIKEPKF